jgi:hypothetical protein
MCFLRGMAATALFGPAIKICFRWRVAGLRSGNLVACGEKVAHREGDFSNEGMHSVADMLLIACRVKRWPSYELADACVLVAD